MTEPTATNPQTGEKLVFRGGQWQPMGAGPAAPAPTAAPAMPQRIYGAPEPKPTYTPPSGYTGTPDSLTPIPGGPADDSGGGGNAPSGYRYKPDGSLEAIPGGPAERGIQGNAIPQAAYEKAETYIGQFTTLANSLDTFEDDFGGNWAGGLENTAQAYSPIPVGTPGQSEWWAGFKALDNQIRNDLFGSALTPVEKQAYSQTTVEPGMNPEKIRANLARRVEIIEGALKRRREFFVANGFKPEAVNAIFSPLDERRAATETDAQGAKPPQFREGDGNVAGVTRDNGDSSLQTTLTQGDTDRQDDPTLAGVRDEYIRRLGEGQSAQEIIKWARSTGIHPSAYRSIQEQVRFRQQNPATPLNQYDTTQLDDKFVQLGAFDQGINSLAQSSVGAGLIAAGDAASAFTLDNIIGATGGNAERARLGMAEVAERNPLPSALGTVAGGAMTALGGEAGLAARGMAGGLKRAMIADSAFGAAAGAGGTDEGNRLAGAAKGLLAGAGGSAVGYKTGNALAGLARGVSDPSVNALRQQGVNALSPGQTYGNSGKIGSAIKSVEERLSGVPIVGDAVNARRTEGYRQFNTKAFDKALEPIGGTVGDAVGEDAIEKAQKLVSDAFTTALQGKGVQIDAPFKRDFTSAVMGLQSVKRVGPEVFDEVIDILKPYVNDPMISGEALQVISRELRDLKFAYAKDPLFKKVGGQVDRVERAVFDMFDRQASGTVPDYNKARQAYRRLSIMEDAVMSAQNAKGQLVTPAQLARADKANTRKYGGKAAAARGDTPFRDLTEPAQDVLPNKVPDSGTAGRVLVPLALVGAGAGVDQTGATSSGLTIGAVLAALYSKTGQRLLTKPGRGMKDGTRRKSALESERTRRAIAATGGASAAALASPQ